MYGSSIKLLLLLFCLFVSTVSIANGDIRPELQQVLNSSQQTDLVDIIIDFSDTINYHTTKLKGKHNHTELLNSAHAKANSSQREIIQFLKSKNITNYKKLWLINALVVTVEAQLVPELAKHIGVRRIRYDKSIKLNNFTEGVAGTPEWNINQINAPALWNAETTDGKGYKGQNVVIGIMDTGVDIKHPELASSYRGGNNSWFDPYFNNPDGSKISVPYDNSTGHGTSVTGIIVAGNASGTNIGVAPASKWIAAKIFDDTGRVLTSAVHRAFEWMLDPDKTPSTKDYPDIVNNSWNSDANVNKCFTEFLPDIAALRAAGISVVFSSGNGGTDLVSSSVSPANYGTTLSVGALDESLAITNFSGKGPSACADTGIYPNLVAPGVGIFTTTKTSGSTVNTYIHLDGTSFSAPHVSGALALLQSAFPGSTATHREKALAYSAIDLGLNGEDNSYGWGYLNIRGAYLVMPDIINNINPLVTLAPVANNDLIKTNRNAAATSINLLLNDFPDTRVVTNNKLDPAKLVIVSNLSNAVGSIIVEPKTGIVKFTPGKDTFGSDGFTYTVTDVLGNVSNIGTVNVSVSGAVPIVAEKKPSSGGGCTLRTQSHFDPVLAFLLFLSLLYLVPIITIRKNR